jgi:hypothetical protein
VVEGNALDLTYFSCELHLIALEGMMIFPRPRKLFQFGGIYNLNAGADWKLFFVSSHTSLSVTRKLLCGGENFLRVGQKIVFQGRRVWHWRIQ